MTRDEALTRLAVCRENQPDARQVTVAADIVDSLLNTRWCPRCFGGTMVDSNGIHRRCYYCRGSGIAA